jgi:hypothetical protein
MRYSPRRLVGLLVVPAAFAALAALGALAALPRAGAAQTPDPAARSTGARLSGIVFDSIAHAPLAGAWVQLAPADGQVPAARTAMTDSLGRFAFDDVPEGRYALGFFHAVLDSLGVEPPVHTIVVRGRRAVRADLGVPSGATLGAVICGQRSSRDSGVVVSGAVVVGVVRDVRARAPVAGATVSGEWLEISFRQGGYDRRRPRLVVTTGANGWYALCNVPNGGTMFLTAGHGADSTDLIEVQVPAKSFARRDLYIGAARTVVLRDSVARPDSLMPRRLRLGDGRLRGTVVTAEGERPLSGAQMRITDGSVARANEHGEWTLANIPAGTRMLEVRAVGFYPERRAVDVVDDAPPVHLALETFKAVLDTVKIVASRVADRQNSGFEERRHTGLGRYLTAEDLVKRGVILTSDAFKNLPGTRMEVDSVGERHIYVRSAFGNGYCEPAFYIDGLHLFTLSADELDGMLSAKYIRAIEVYNEATVPPQFTMGLAGCGSIVIWTK